MRAHSRRRSKSLDVPAKATTMAALTSSLMIAPPVDSQSPSSVATRVAPLLVTFAHIESSQVTTDPAVPSMLQYAAAAYWAIQCISVKRAESTDLEAKPWLSRLDEAAKAGAIAGHVSGVSILLLATWVRGS